MKNSAAPVRSFEVVRGWPAQNPLHHFPAPWLKWTGLLLGTAGGALVGWNLSDNLMKGTSDWTPALIGAGAVALGIPFALLADGQLRSAAEAYNGSFTQSQSQSKVPVSTVPFFAVVPKREGGNQCLAGVTMSF